MIPGENLKSDQFWENDQAFICAALAEAAIDHLASHRTRGYVDATHRMIFPRSSGFIQTEAEQSSDIFVRAIVADALCDARDAGFMDPTAILASECNYLLERRRRSSVGGWSYFPNLDELPCDIDDLAQIMQVFCRCGRKQDLIDYVEPVLSVVIENGIRADGAIGTWILPAQNRSTIEERQADFVQNAWGDGSDPDAIANFLYALAMYDQPRFAKVIEGGSRFLRGCQRSDGSWESTWYEGPYYGTYVCSRLLRYIADDGMLQRSYEFLLRSQLDDGGWSCSVLSNQLATGVALCAFATILGRRLIKPNDKDCIKRAIQMLATSIHSRGWESPVFIRMNLGRVRGANGPWRIHGNSAFTASYVLKAVCAIKNIINSA